MSLSSLSLFSLLGMACFTAVLPSVGLKWCRHTLLAHLSNKDQTFIPFAKCEGTALL